MKECRVDEAFVKLLALVDFAEHELATESVFFAKRLEEVFLVERFDEFRIVRVDSPVLSQPLKQRLSHVLEVAANIEVVKSDSVIAFQIEMLENEA